MDRLSRFAIGFGFNIEVVKFAQEAWHESLSYLPPDILDRAVRSCLKAHTDTFRLPMPGQILEHAGTEYGDRWIVAQKIQWAQERAGMAP